MTVNEAISKVREFLDKGQVSEAVACIQRAGVASPWIVNARGVCLLRTGQFEPALSLFRELAFPRGAACMAPETPTVTQTNFITTMMLSGHMPQGLSLIQQVRDQQHPETKRLKQAVADWKASHGTLQRVLITLGFSNGRPFTMESPGALDS